MKDADPTCVPGNKYMVLRGTITLDAFLAEPAEKICMYTSRGALMPLMAFHIPVILPFFYNRGRILEKD